MGSQISEGNSLQVEPKVSSGIGECVSSSTLLGGEEIREESPRENLLSWLKDPRVLVTALINNLELVRARSPNSSCQLEKLLHFFWEESYIPPMLPISLSPRFSSAVSWQQLSLNLFTCCSRGGFYAWLVAASLLCSPDADGG